MIFHARASVRHILHTGTLRRLPGTDLRLGPFPFASSRLSWGMPQHMEHMNESVLPYARKDFPELRQDFTVQQALDRIRQHGVGERVIYFYVVDEHQRLQGVLPTRRLLTSPPDLPLANLMIRRVVTIPHTATILEACEQFVLHRFLAFPLVDEQRHMMGVVDISLFTEEVMGLEEGEGSGDMFEALGFRLSQARAATPWRAFRLRFPWLLTTIGSGLGCAVLASAFERTLAEVLVIAFFITLVLALGEAVAIQSMSLTIQALRSAKPTLGWFARSFWRETATALLLGTGCGTVVVFFVSVWRGVSMAAFVVGGSIVLSLCAACFFGLAIPALLHWLKLDPKIAAGPVSLALTDIFTLLFYFGLAALLL
jgi:magnesium transporter